MPSIVSTMTHDVKYTLWQSNPGGINIPKKFILIKGGHGVARRDAAGGLHTPNGVVTAVTEDELAFLQADEVFCTHLKSGGVKVVSSAAAKAPEKVTLDMGQSPDRPLTPKDSEKGGRATVPDSMKVNGGKNLQ